MKPARPGQLVLVDWLDAHADNRWTDASEVETSTSRVRSVGWVVEHTSKAITLFADGDRRKPLKSEVNRTITIPAGMIEHVWEVHL